MIDAPIGLAFVAGTVAAFNPCGFALLPGYVAYYLGGEERPTPGRAMVVAGSVSAGFVAVFGLIGLLIVSVSSSILQLAPWTSVVIGLAMIPLGIAVAKGKQLKIPIPGMGKARAGTGPASMFTYGVVYALASLACTIPPFLVTVSTTFGRTNFVSGMAVFLAYAAGMATILTILTVALASAKQQLVGKLRAVLPYVTTASGWLLVVAGIYVVYYGWFQLDALDGETVAAGPAEFVAGISETVSRFVGGLSATTLIVTLVVIVAAAVAIVIGTKSNRSGPTMADEPAISPAVVPAMSPVVSPATVATEEASS